MSVKTFFQRLFKKKQKPTHYRTKSGGISKNYSDYSSNEITNLGWEPLILDGNDYIPTDNTNDSVSTSFGGGLFGGGGGGSNGGGSSWGSSSDDGGGYDSGGDSGGDGGGGD